MNRRSDPAEEHPMQTANARKSAGISSKQFTPARQLKLLALALALAELAATAHAQFLPSLRNVDLAVGIEERYPVPLSKDILNASMDQPTRPGVSGQFRYHPSSWAGFEVSFRSKQTIEPFANSARSLSKVSTAEASYLIHGHRSAIQPFFSIGAGAVIIKPQDNTSSQARIAAVTNFGFDLPFENPHFGLSLEGSGVFYHAATVEHLPVDGVEKVWIGTLEPSAKLYIRY